MTEQRDNLQDSRGGSLRKAAERRKAFFLFNFRLQSSDSKTALLGPEAGKKILVAGGVDEEVVHLTAARK